MDSKKEQKDKLEDRLEMLYFSSPTCQPCKKYFPIVEEVAEVYSGMMNFRKVDITEEPKVAQDHNVMGVPTTLYKIGNTEVYRAVGTMDADELNHHTKRLLSYKLLILD